MTQRELIYLGACIIMSGGKHVPGEALVLAESLLDGVGEATGAYAETEAELRAQERRMLQEALTKAGGNKVQAARMLGIKRTTLCAKLKKLGSEGPQENAA